MPELPDDSTMRSELLAVIAKEAVIPPERLTDDATLEALGVQSVDMVMVLMAIEERYSVYLPIDAELSEVKTLPQLLDLFIARIRTAPSADQRPPETIQQPAVLPDTGSAND